MIFPLHREHSIRLKSCEIFIGPFGVKELASLVWYYEIF